MITISERAEEKFARLAPTGEPDACWRWIGYVAPNGYGWLNVGALKIPAHRFALQRAGRPVPKGMDACHTCDVRACVNPRHLYAGTRAQNMADCTSRRRHNKPSGERHWRTRLSDDDVRAMRAARAAGATTVELGRRFGVNTGTVSRIVRAIWRSEVSR